MNLFDYSDEELLAFAKDISRGLTDAADGTAAADSILHALQRFTISDLQLIGANIRYEVEKLPEPYRSITARQNYSYCFHTYSPAFINDLPLARYASL